MLLSACDQENLVKQPNEIPPEILQKLADAQFVADGAVLEEDGYLVEGDIKLDPKALAETPVGETFGAPQGEQYRTYRWVERMPRTIGIKIYDQGGGRVKIRPQMRQALDAAVKAYNDAGVRLQMKVVPPGQGGQSITIIPSLSTKGTTVGEAYFPSEGDPGRRITVFDPFYDLDFTTMKFVLMHEIGHTIGLRHTDYYSRSRSCGGEDTRGREWLGAVPIAGTPQFDDRSLMRSCQGNYPLDPRFTSNDKKALEVMYGKR